MKNDIVIDIETLDTVDSAVIVSIAAVVFNRNDAPGTYIDEIHIKLDTENQPGRTISASTVAWWMSKGMEDARNEAFNVPKNEKIRLGLALKQLEDFIKKYDLEECWGCSPDFDMGILSHAYEQHKVKFPMPFWKFSDIRTIEKFFYSTNTRKKGGKNWLNGTAHDALDDCYMEANVVQNCHKAASVVKNYL